MATRYTNSLKKQYFLEMLENFEGVSKITLQLPPSPSELSLNLPHLPLFLASSSASSASSSASSFVLTAP